MEHQELEACWKAGELLRDMEQIAGDKMAAKAPSAGNTHHLKLEPIRPTPPSAADLKSLARPRQNRVQGLQIESGTRIIDLLVPMTFRSS